MLEYLHINAVVEYGRFHETTRNRENGKYEQRAHENGATTKHYNSHRQHITFSHRKTKDINRTNRIIFEMHHCSPICNLQHIFPKTK